MKITDHKNWQQIKKLIPASVFDFLLYSYYNLRTIKYYGNRMYCPVCDTKLGKFKGASCPKCAAGIRHRTVWLFLQRKTNFFNDRMKFLHFAPEFCFLKPLKKLTHLDYLSADYNSPRAMLKADMTNLQFEDDEFDALLSIDVLDDVQDDVKAISELYRIQKPGGWSIHLSPIDNSREVTFEDPSIVTPEQRLEHYGAYANQRRYGRDYKEKFISTGFKTSVFRPKDFCSEEEISKMKLNANFEIYYFEK